MDNVGLNPMHEKKLNLVKFLSRKKRYTLSKILRDLTKNRNLGINVPKNLFPKKNTKPGAEKPHDAVSSGRTNDTSTAPRMAWIDWSFIAFKLHKVAVWLRVRFVF